MNRLIIAFVTAASLGCAHHHETEGHAHEHPAPPAATSATPDAELNPVQREMRLLLTAVQDAMAGVAAGDVRAVPGSFHRVHLAKETTAAALKSGAWKPAKGGDAAAFEAVDVAFHGKLEVLVGAAARNDVAATGNALGDVVRDCHACHSQFRK